MSYNLIKPQRKAYNLLYFLSINGSLLKVDNYGTATLWNVEASFSVLMSFSLALFALNDASN